MSQDENIGPAQDNTREMGAPEHTVIVDVPRELGAYRLVKLIGRGGMGEVWKAFDQHLERDVAIKLMRKELLANEDATRRFAREARAVARLNHPNIVQVYAFGDEKGVNYFAMEMVEGETVSDCLKRSKHMPLAEAVQILLQAIEGLSYANARGIIHRDIKPSNIMLDQTRRVKLTDFGLAKMVEHDTQMTAAGTAMGSPNYMSPEQARGEEADHRSDIYALGISFYQMLCGDLPFTAHSPVSVLLKQIQEPLPEHELIKCLSDGAVLHVLKKMTAKKPEDRYQSYGELATDLAALAPGIPLKGAHGITSTLPAATPTATPTALDRSADLSPIRTTSDAAALAEANTAAATTPPPPMPPLPPKEAAVEPPSVSPPEDQDKDRSRVGLIMAAAAAFVILLVGIAGWYLLGDREQRTSSAPEVVSASPAPEPQPTAVPSTPAPTAAAPTASSAPSTAQPAAAMGTPVQSATVTQPASGMQAVDVTALVTPRITPAPGVTLGFTPTPDIKALMPKSLQTSPTPTAPAAQKMIIFGMANSTSSDPIPTYVDAQGRSPYRTVAAGTQAAVIGETPLMYRVIPENDTRAVYVYKKMAHPKP